MKKILLLLVLIINILTICACVPKDAYISGDDYIDVECSSLYKLEHYDKDDITWSSSNENVLTIINGMVLAHDAGEAYIYAKVKNKVFEKKVIVTFPNISITINGRSSLYINEEAVFTYDLSISLEKEVTWSSSDESILTIDNSGKLAVSDSAPEGAVMVGKIMRSRNMGSIITTAVRNYGFARKMFEVKVESLA
jgi:hypothetical protein